MKAALELSNTAYGIAIAAFSAGALTAGMTAAALIRRFGSARVAVGASLVVALGVLVAGFAPTAAVFAAALFAGGAADAITDVGQNAHGLRVQRRYGRSIINSFHAVWSIGAVSGGAMAAAAIALRLPLGVHLSISGALFAGMALLAGRFCLRGPDARSAIEPDGLPDAGAPAGGTARAGTGRRGARPGGRTLLTLGALVLITSASSIVEDTGSTWTAVYLTGSLGAAPAVGAFGFMALLGAEFAGRLAGDRLVDRFGQRNVARAGGMLVGAGMSAALAWPSIPVTIAGFAAAGLGVATLVPAAMQAADELPGLRPGTGLTVVSWLMRVTFLVSPPLVGAVADAAGLRAGLTIVPVRGLVTKLVALVLSAVRRHGDRRCCALPRGMPGRRHNRTADLRTEAAKELRMKRIVFLDVDGTLVDYHGQLPESAAQAVRAARAAGHLVYLSTGRSKAEVYDHLWQVGFDGLIGGNGSYVEHHGEVVMHQCLPADDCARVVDWLHERGCEFYLESSNGLFASERFADVAEPVVRAYAQGKGDPQASALTLADAFPGLIYGGELYRDDVSKISYILSSYADHTDAMREFPHLKAGTWGGRDAQPLFGDLGVSGITKAHAIHVLLERIGGDIAATVAFGDARVDIPMFEACACNVAMGNGSEDLKAIADLVTDDVERDGLAKAFARLGLLGTS